VDLVTMLPAFVLAVVGAAVLIWLGVKAWRGALTGEVELSEAAAPAATWWRRFGEGMRAARPPEGGRLDRRSARQIDTPVQTHVMTTYAAGCVGVAQGEEAAADPLALEAGGERHPAGRLVLHAVVELHPGQTAALR
jgi:hypothetical protein